jgi:hypothetical protein
LRVKIHDSSLTFHLLIQLIFIKSVLGSGDKVVTKVDCPHLYGFVNLKWKAGTLMLTSQMGRAGMGVLKEL